MASIDASWLGMEDPTNLMMVTGILALDGKVARLPHWEDDAKPGGVVTS